MTIRFIAILLVFIISCKVQTADWQTLDFGVFKLRTPQDWKIIKKQGIDSYYGGLTNGKDSLWFDYGWYSVNLNGEVLYKQRFANDTVNGFAARVMIPDTVGKGYISMYIPKVTEKDKLTIWGENIQGTDLILKIYKSIIFKNSDTSNNPALISSKFTYTGLNDHRVLFILNCASCHSINKDATGPALAGLINKRGNEWLYTFLTNKKAVIKDSIYYDLLKKYEGFRCQEFPNLTQDDVNMIADYIDGN